MSLRRSVGVVLCGLFCFGCARLPSARRVDAAAAMLFAGYETVAGAEVSALPFETLGKQNDDPRVFLILPFGFLFAALEAAAPKADELAMSQTTAVLAGMKDFRAPNGFGGVNSRNCYVLIVKQGFDLGRLLGKPPTERWEGAPVWRWSASLHEFGEQDDRLSTIIAVQMTPYVLVSNDPDSIFANARALQRGSTAILRGLTEWRDASSHEYWIYRRFRFDAPEPMAAGLHGIRRDAKSMVLLYSRRPSTATLRLVGAQGAATAPTNIIEDGRVPAMNPVSSRAWEAKLPLRVGAEAAEAWFIVLGTLGFAIYV